MDASTRRILDAAANRAREACRTLEDIARFALDDAATVEQLKALRHELTDALRALPGGVGGLLASRDASADVGAELSTLGERTRSSLRDVALAAASRASESLRTLEECAKVVERSANPAPPAPLPQGEGGKEPSPSGRGLGEGQQEDSAISHFKRSPESVRKARELRRRMTAPERSLWRALSHDNASGLRFRRQHVIGPYIVDFCCPQAKLVIEVDGRSHAGPDEADRDRVRETWLIAQGYQVLRFANDNVLRDPHPVAAKIAEVARARIAQRNPSPPAPLPQGEGGKEPSPSGKWLGEGQQENSASAAIERLRMRAYDISRDVALALGVQRDRCAAWRLCVILSEALCARPWLDVAQAAIDAGADCLQLREKALPDGELLARARTLVDLAHPAGVAVVVNDRPDIALLASADGAHVGQRDLAVRDIRRLAGDGLAVGVSAASLDEARAARLAGADYIGVGAMFETATKRKDAIAGPALLRDCLAQNPPLPPILAIGGIGPATVAQLVEAARGKPFGVAVCAAVCAADDPAGACKALHSALDAGARCAVDASSDERTIAPCP